MISVDDAIEIQSMLIEKFGGAKGLRDRNLLESALNRPYQSFGDEYLYPTPQEKASAIIESLLINHPFIDGNKRIGYVMMRLVLIENGLDLSASENVKYDFIIKITRGEYKYNNILIWIKEHTKEL